MSECQSSKFFLGLAIGFGLCAAIALKNSILEDGIAMLAVAISAAALHFGIRNAALPLIAFLAWGFKNQGLGLYSLAKNATVVNSADKVEFLTIWANIGISIIFLGVCAYAAIKSYKKWQST